jgi:hypothetical protein
MRMGGNSGITGASMLFSIICCANFRQKSSWGIVVSFFARARDCTAFTSATEHRKVNWRIAHHFVPQTSSKPIGS